MRLAALSFFALTPASRALFAQAPEAGAPRRFEEAVAGARPEMQFARKPRRWPRRLGRRQPERAATGTAIRSELSMHQSFPGKTCRLTADTCRPV
jgi:hypothetical protein